MVAVLELVERHVFGSIDLEVWVFVNMIKKFSPGKIIFAYFFLLRDPTYLYLFLTIIKILVLQTAAGNIINMLWQLMENSLEELKLLQTVLVLLTTNTK